MIFLKKFIAAGFLSAVTGVFLCGCVSGTHKVPSVPETDWTVTTIPAAEKTTVSSGKLVEPQTGVFIYDKASTLTNTEYSECNEYAEMLYSKYLLNTAVVITNDLEGMKPEAYAAEVYNDIYGGMGSGLVFLVNNDTHDDILYKTGQCQRFIDEVSERDELYHATKELVVENYKDAILIMLKLGEKCPTNVIDNSNLFDEDMAQEFSGSLAGCPNSVTLVATDNKSGVSNDELIKTYYERRYTDETGYIVLMDKNTRSVTAMTQGELPAEVAEFITAADQTAANNDFIGAANRIVEGFGGAAMTIYDNDEEEMLYDETVPDDEIISDGEYYEDTEE